MTRLVRWWRLNRTKRPDWYTDRWAALAIADLLDGDTHE